MGTRLRAALFLVIFLFCRAVQADEEESLPIAPQSMDGFSGVIQEPFAPDSTEPRPMPVATKPAAVPVAQKTKMAAKPVVKGKTVAKVTKSAKRVPSQAIQRVKSKKKALVKKKSKAGKR